jgi:hypothetical protein
METKRKPVVIFTNSPIRIQCEKKPKLGREQNKMKPITAGGRKLCHYAMNNLRLRSLAALSVTLMLAATALVKAQSVAVESQPSLTPELPVAEQATMKGVDKSGVQPLLPAASFSGFCVFRYNGSGRIINCTSPSIKANSRVFMSISEYSTLPTTRLIGAARMTIHNISPYNGGVKAWTDVEWPFPLNVRIDVLVDP